MTDPRPTTWSTWTRSDTIPASGERTGNGRSMAVSSRRPCASPKRTSASAALRRTSTSGSSSRKSSARCRMSDWLSWPMVQAARVRISTDGRCAAWTIPGYHTDAFATATAAAPGRVIVYLTHGTKTGLIAPVSPPPGADVIVDACQGRISPETVAAYLRQGWPVVVTGSKFFGGPAFSGAVLFPQTRLSASAWRLLPSASDDIARL